MSGDEAIDRAGARGLVRRRTSPGADAAAHLRADLRRPLEPHLRASPTPAGTRWALRRPPLGKRLGLRPRHGARAPDHLRPRGHRRCRCRRSSALCEDESVNGAPFYVMEFVEGPILRSSPEAEASSTRRSAGAIGERVVDTLVAIHAVDPDAVGLGDLGRKQDYVARQLHRWHGPVGEVEDARAAADRRRPRAPRPRGSPSRGRRRSSTATTGSTT